MAFAFVQTFTPASDAVGNVASLSLTGSATTAGSLVVVGVKLSDAGNTCNSVTDNVGNTYVLFGPYDAGSRRSYMAYGVQVTGGATSITASFNAGGTTTKAFKGIEISGGAATNAEVFDVSSTGTGTSTSPSVATFSPAASGELIVAFISIAASVTWTAGSGYVLSGANPSNFGCQYNLAGATSETAALTTSSSRAWAEIAMAFKPASGASVNSGFFRFM